MDPVAHASVGLMVKCGAPGTSVWALLAATQVPDLLSFGFMAVGMERGAETVLDFEHGLRYLSLPSIGWSHGLLMCVVWSLLVAAIAFVFCRDRRASALIGVMVLSHWALDTIVYPYMPLAFDGSPWIGLGLITSGTGLIAGILLEIVLIAGGLVAYLATRRRKPATPSA
jgi:membrane-bound metal-dependent hydrolase YbcI (DUF457 family)